MSDSLPPHESQHTRPPCPSPAPKVHPNSCPSSRWCHPTISSSVVPFSSCPQSLPASESFPMSQLFAWGGQRWICTYPAFYWVCLYRSAFSTWVQTFSSSSVAQSRLTLCNPMDCGFPFHHQLPEPTQTHVHHVSDGIQPSHHLLSPSPPAFNLSQHQGLIQWVGSLHQVTKVLEFQLQHQSFQWIFRADFL